VDLVVVDVDERTCGTRRKELAQALSEAGATSNPHRIKKLLSEARVRSAKPPAPRPLRDVMFQAASTSEGKKDLIAAIAADKQFNEECLNEAYALVSFVDTLKRLLDLGLVDKDFSLIEIADDESEIISDGPE
jgi:hypothetical protein